MKGFGIHTSIWAMNWTREGAEYAVSEAQKYPLDFIEIALLDPPMVDASHSRKLLKQAGLSAVCSLGLPEKAWASVRPDEAVEFLKVAVDKCAGIGPLALSGVIFGGIGERTGVAPTEAELDNVAWVLQTMSKYARARGIELGIEPVNRYENHLINTGWQAVEMIERVGADNIFIHLDTYHMNI